MTAMRRVRGIVGTMAVWAAAFGLVGLAGLLPLALLGAFPPYLPGRFVHLLGDVFARWALGGAAMGLSFAAAVLLTERNRSLDALSSRRFVAWGFAAGAVVPLGMAIGAELTGHGSPALDLRSGAIFAGVCGVAGATVAVAMLRAVRRGAGSAERVLHVHEPVG